MSQTTAISTDWMTDLPPDFEFGSIEFQGEDVGYEVQCDRICLSQNGGLLLAGFVADTMKVKAVRAVLATNKKVSIRYSRVKATRPKDYEWQSYLPTQTSGYANRHGEGYEFAIQKLRYGMAHVLCWTKSPDFIRCNSQIALWQALKSDTLTTPLVPWWLPWLEKELLKKNYLGHPFNWRCNCATLVIDTASLDEIVSRGLREGHLTVKPPEDYIPTIL